MDKQNSKIFVTGATGFLGSYIVRALLRRGYAVRAFRRTNSPSELSADFADRVEWAQGDMLDVVALEEALQGCTHAVHCAAMVSFHPRDARLMRQINVEGTANLVNLCLENGLQKLVHASSIASLGRSKDRPELNENDKWVEASGNTRYAVTKFQSEQEVWRGQAEGLATAIVNPAMIIGAGYWHVSTGRIFQQIGKGLKLYPIGRSGFVDVRDVAEFMVLLLESDIQGERYILNAQNMTHREFFNAVAAALGKKPPTIPVTPLLAEIGWRVEWLKEKLFGMEPMLTKESARSSMAQFYYSAEKSKSVFSFRYRPIEESIRETAEAFKASKEKGFAVWK